MKLNDQSEHKKKSTERVERRNEPIEIMEMEHEISQVPEEDE